MCGGIGRCSGCKYTANAPRTVDGRALWDIARRSGVQQRVGLAGVVVGFDWNAALALCAGAGIAAQVASWLLAEIERHMLMALQENIDG